jgi:hypothetical protein
LQIALLINIKWFIRLILAGFWIVAAYLAATGRGFITWMLANHTSTSLVIVFLTFYYLLQPFYAPFFQIRKTGQGGEVLMEKSTKILLVIVAILASFVTVMFASPGARETIIKGAINVLGKPLVTGWFNFVDWLDTFRASYMLAVGLVGGLVIAIFVNLVALPKIHGTPTVPTSGGMGTSGLGAKTPVGATLRPTVAEAKNPTVLDLETEEESAET